MADFYTEVIKASPLFRSLHPVADLDLLHPVMRRKVLACIEDLKGHGITGHVQETYRSSELQQIYYKRGVTKLKTVGVHHYGLACDIVFLDAHGNPNWDADYSPLGRVAKAHGMVWGGDWGRPDLPHSFRDYDHVQWCDQLDQNKLFSGAWYPDDDYIPAHIG